MDLQKIRVPSSLKGFQNNGPINPLRSNKTVHFGSIIAENVTKLHSMGLNVHLSCILRPKMQHNRPLL